MSTERLERLTNLVLVLLDATQPVTLEEIGGQVPGYPADREARRQTFERDKRLLRDEGIPLLTEPVEGDAQYGYRIDPAQFYLPDLGLTPDEQSALHLAVAGVHLGDPSGRDALTKLGATGLADGPPLASFVPPPALVPLFDAVRARAEVTFAYRGEQRRVAPGGLWFRHGYWYLVGWDAERDAGRTFRVDRVEGTPGAGAPGSAVLPDGFDPAAAVPAEPWRPGTEDGDDVVVRLDGVEGPRVAAEVGPAAVVSRAPDGGVTVRLGVTSAPAMRSWLLGLLDHAELVAPPGLRADLVAWLEAVAAGPPAGDPPRALAPPGPTAAPAPSDPRKVSVRLQRLLAMVGWLARVGEAPIAEVARRFDMTEEDLVAELELAACCGLPPYSPDMLMEIVVTDETVQTFLPAELGRPRPLTPAEGFAVAASARTILSVPGADHDGALARALAKLDAALGDHARLVVEVSEPALLQAVRAAADGGRRLEIEYHSASSDDVTTRLVDPLRVVLADGHWYLVAFCHRADDVRRFRVDRIRSAVPKGPRPALDQLPAAALDDSFVPGPGAVTVAIHLGPASLWVADSVPLLARVPTDDGGADVTLAVGGTAWLERLLLQAGPDSWVSAPAELAGVGPAAARRVLARYR